MTAIATMIALTQIDSPVCKPCKDADLDVLRRGGGGIQE